LLDFLGKVEKDETLHLVFCWRRQILDSLESWTGVLHVTIDAAFVQKAKLKELNAV